MNKSKYAKYIFLLLIIVIVQLLQKFKNTTEQFKINYNVSTTKKDISDITKTMETQLNRVEGNIDDIIDIFNQ